MRSKRPGPSMIKLKRHCAPTVNNDSGGGRGGGRRSCRESPCVSNLKSECFSEVVVNPCCSIAVMTSACTPRCTIRVAKASASSTSVLSTADEGKQA
eukprot:scaffold25270_cov104-Isochrysis_galbana.AAC.6